eukprot:m.149290 g.149290  ORF g.149290 m.149290 type:complete len:92 (+) comp38519_c0_seq36:598-873(+)
MSVTDAGRDGGSVIQKQKDYPAQPGNIQKIEIKDLDADALYKITVAAINDQGLVGKQSNSVTVSMFIVTGLLCFLVNTHLRNPQVGISAKF